MIASAVFALSEKRGESLEQLVETPKAKPAHLKDVEQKIQVKPLLTVANLTFIAGDIKCVTPSVWLNDNVFTMFKFLLKCDHLFNLFQNCSIFISKA